MLTLISLPEALAPEAPPPKDRAMDSTDLPKACDVANHHRWPSHPKRYCRTTSRYGHQNLITIKRLEEEIHEGTFKIKDSVYLIIEEIA